MAMSGDLRLVPFPKVKVGVAVVIALAAAPINSPVLAESDVFLQAVQFALTGSDNITIKSIERSTCTFRIEYDLFHLSNVQVDRLVIQRGLGFTTVELHGSAPIHEQIDMFLDAGFTPPKGVTNVASNEHKLNLMTDDSDRVTRAWQYIYSHGCVGQKSPF
jgi:hypothetical protein